MLVSENIRHVLTEDYPPPPTANAPCGMRHAIENWFVADNKATGYMLATMSESLQTKLEKKITSAEIM